LTDVRLARATQRSDRRQPWAAVGAEPGSPRYGRRQEAAGLGRSSPRSPGPSGVGAGLGAWW